MQILYSGEVTAFKNGEVGENNGIVIRENSVIGESECNDVTLIA